MLVGLLCVCAIHFGCDEAIGRSQVTWHPIQDSLSVDPEEAIRVAWHAPDSVPTFLETFSERLNHRIVTATIGVLDGEQEYVFGEVVDALFLTDGSLALLDRQAGFIRVFDQRGSHSYSVGGRGEGPGELDFPVALVAPAAEELWVVEGGRGVHRFTEKDEGLVFVDRLDIDSYSVKDACVSAGSVIIHIPSHVTEPDQAESAYGEVLFSYGRDGGRLSQFAVPYRYSPWLVATRMKRGFVTCTSDAVVLLAFEFQNRLDAYRATDGQLLWHASFDEIHIPLLKEELRSDGRLAVGIDIRRGGPTYHFLLSLTGGDGTPVMIQYGRRTQQEALDGVDRYIVETYAVDPSTGEGMYLGEDLPQVLTLTKDRVVFLHVDPFPRVEVARLPSN